MKYFHTKSKVQTQLHLREKREKMVRMYFIPTHISIFFSFQEFTKLIFIFFMNLQYFLCLDGFHRKCPPFPYDNMA